MKNEFARPVALAVVAVLFVWWVFHLDTPFSRVPGFADWIGNRNGLIVDNYLRFGLDGTGGAQVMNLEPTTEERERIIYRGHPPTLDLLTAGVAAALGSNAPWLQRLWPLLGSALSFVLLYRLARATGGNPWWAILLLAAFPLTAVHGVNFSYEPLCLPAMLLLVLLFVQGWRWRLLPLVFVTGLIDWPVLYLAPFFAVVELVRKRRAGKAVLPALGYGTALAGVAIASFSTVAIHQVLTMGGLEGFQGQPWHVKVLQSFWPPHLPGPVAWFAGQAGFLHESFTWPGVFLAIVGLVVLRGRIGVASSAFLFAGALHLLAFRGHAHLHDFWLWYWLPFFALTGTRGVMALPQVAGWLLLAAVLGFGAWCTTEVWNERRAPPVREVAEDLRRLFPPETVLHQMRAPPGWAMEPYRAAPVMEAGDLLLEVVEERTFRRYLDIVGGTWGYLRRPQRAFLFVPGSEAGDEGIIEQDFPDARIDTKEGAAGRYHVYDIERFLADPASSPRLLELLGEDECERLWYRARMHVVVSLFEPGTRLLWLDGRRSVPERLRGRTVRSGDDKELVEGERASRWTVVAWPDTSGAERLSALAGDRLQHVELEWLGRSWRVPFLPPDAVTVSRR